MANLRLVPQPGLVDSTAGLLVTWTLGDGDLDLYAVSLSTPVSPPPRPAAESLHVAEPPFCLQDGAVIETRPVPKHVTSLDFLDLIPGHMYTITVQSQSGKLSNANRASGRTGEAELNVKR